MTQRPWTHLTARFWSRKESERLRIIGTVVLVLSIAAACLFYGIKAGPAPPPMDDLLPGYARAQAREIGVLMGHTGVIMLEWQDALARPGTQAIIIGAVGALFALYFFRAAWILDDAERHRVPQKDDGPGARHPQLDEESQKVYTFVNLTEGWDRVGSIYGVRRPAA